MTDNIEFVKNKLMKKLEEKQQELEHFQSCLENPELTKLEKQLNCYQFQKLQNEIDEIQEMIEKLNEVLIKI